jgi:hypothetical protein
MSVAMAANGPVSGSGTPMRTGSLLCALRMVGKLRVAAAAVAVVRNMRRCMAASFRETTVSNVA